MLTTTPAATSITECHAGYSATKMIWPQKLLASPNLYCSTFATVLKNSLSFRGTRTRNTVVKRTRTGCLFNSSRRLGFDAKRKSAPKHEISCAVPGLPAVTMSMLRRDAAPAAMSAADARRATCSRAVSTTLRTHMRFWSSQDSSRHALKQPGRSSSCSFSSQRSKHSVSRFLQKREAMRGPGGRGRV